MRKMFSEKQIQKLVEDPLSSGEVAIVGKTLEQKEPNWEYDISEELQTMLASDLEFSGFSKFLQYGNELYFIIGGKIKNNSASQHTGACFTGQLTLELPEKIASKIYDEDGNKVSDTIASTVPIINFRTELGTSAYGIRTQFVNYTQANQCYIGLNALTHTINAGASISMDIRLVILL